jgi:hypothetical protein
VIRCACRYARKASGWEADHSPRARLAYAGRLVAGLALLTGRRFAPGVALVAARGVLPKLAPALGAVPALLKSAWVWLGGFSLAAATAVTIGGAPHPVPADGVQAPAAVECPATPDARPCPSSGRRAASTPAAEPRTTAAPVASVRSPADVREAGRPRDDGVGPAEGVARP